MDDKSSLLTVTQIAAQLNVPSKTIYYWVQRGQIPYLRIGRHLRFQCAAVISFFQAQMKDTRLPCRPINDLIKGGSWFEKNLSSRRSLKNQTSALLKQKE